MSNASNEPPVDSRAAGRSNSYVRDGQNRWALLDFAVARDYDIFQFVMLRYLDRWKRKDGVADLRKLADYLDKYISDNTCGGATAVADPAMNVGMEGAMDMGARGVRIPVGAATESEVNDLQPWPLTTQEQMNAGRLSMKHPVGDATNKEVQAALGRKGY